MAICQAFGLKCDATHARFEAESARVFQFMYVGQTARYSPLPGWGSGTSRSVAAGGAGCSQILLNWHLAPEGLTPPAHSSQYRVTIQTAEAGRY